MSRGEFITTITCDRCGKSEDLELPDRYLRFGQSFISDILSDMDWVMDNGVDICSSCIPPESTG